MWSSFAIVVFGSAIFTVSQARSFKDAVIGAHNEARALHKPQVPMLQYDDAIAAVAQKWADSCPGLTHNPAIRGTYGENIWFMWSSDVSGLAKDTDAAKQAVDYWMGEKKDYNLGSNKCNPGRMCGHYTQMVWKNTKKVGCGYKLCTGGSNPEVIVVCDYSPPGNYVGQRPF